MRAITVMVYCEGGVIYEQQQSYAAVLSLGLRKAIQWTLDSVREPVLRYIVVRNTTISMEYTQAVKTYAIENYNQGGWDFIVECYSDDELTELIHEGKPRNEQEAINWVSRIIGVFDERRQLGNMEATHNLTHSDNNCRCDFCIY